MSETGSRHFRATVNTAVAEGGAKEVTYTDTGAKRSKQPDGDGGLYQSDKPVVDG